MKLRKSETDNYTFTDERSDGNLTVHGSSSLTTLDSIITLEEDNNDMVCDLNTDFTNVSNNCIVPDVCNTHTPNVDQRNDHPSKLTCVNNRERLEQCRSFIRMISNEPCFKYHSRSRGECKCLEILSTDIDLFESATKSLFLFCNLKEKVKNF